MPVESGSETKEMTEPCDHLTGLTPSGHDNLVWVMSFVNGPMPDEPFSFCPKCGVEIEEFKDFCPACGHDLSNFGFRMGAARATPHL